jgi:hypothetical protein
MKEKQQGYAPDGFVNMLLNLNGGAVIEELDRAVIDGLQAIHDNGGKSEITLKVKLSNTVGLDKTITVENDVKTNFPQEKRPNSLMFVTHGLGLVTQHQEQQQLPLAQAEKPAAPVLSRADTANVTHLKQ